MKRRSAALTAVCIVACLLLFIASACSSASPLSGFNTGSSNGGNSSSGASSGGTSSSGASSGGTSSGIILHEEDGGVIGPTMTDGGCAGLQCQIANNCTNDGGTTITGKVMDPAGANPLYNVLAYVPMFDPANPSVIPPGYGIEPITGGVTFPSGVTCDNCSYLYTGNPIAIGVSDTDGNFTITNAPSGSNIPVVIQVGKWRTHATVATVNSCTSNSAGSINMPSTVPTTDPIVSMPQMAISLGGADSLECLLYRVGISTSEIVAGAGSTGHVHVFAGGGFSLSGAPTSSTSMWDSLTDLEKYDVALFSCEGSETTAANPPIFEQYVNAGGRAFLSHYHYAWLAGPLETGASAGYTQNPDWTNLASWNSNDQGAQNGTIVGAKIDTTLNVGGGTFAKGVALDQWLTNVGALGTNSVPAGELAVNGPSYDPNVTSSNTESQPWATFDNGNAYPTAYFSFDTPVTAVATSDGGAPPYCGRVVFSGLHVGAASAGDANGTMPSSTTCNPGVGQLSPQEKILEFMLFDLAACVTPDKAAPGIPIPPPPPPPPPK